MKELLRDITISEVLSKYDGDALVIKNAIDPYLLKSKLTETDECIISSIKGEIFIIIDKKKDMIYYDFRGMWMPVWVNLGGDNIKSLINAVISYYINTKLSLNIDNGEVVIDLDDRYSQQCKLSEKMLETIKNIKR